MRFFVSLLILLEFRNSWEGRLNNVMLSLWWDNIYIISCNCNQMKDSPWYTVNITWLYITSISCKSDLIKHSPWNTVVSKDNLQSIVTWQILNKIIIHLHFSKPTGCQSGQHVRITRGAGVQQFQFQNIYILYKKIIY